jgi:hypothetical protein
LHGLYLVFGNLTASFRQKLRALSGLDRMGGLLTALQIATVFVLVTAAWVFFRASNIQDGFYIVGHLASLRGFQMDELFSLGLPRFELATAFAMILAVAVTEWCIAERPRLITGLWAGRPFRWALTYACVFATIFFGAFGHIEFIYFQF